MKKLVLLFIATATFFSCSSDKDEGEELDTVFSIVGEWEFKELDVTGATGNVDLVEDVLTELVANGCDVATLDFRDNNTITASIKDHTQTGVDIRPGGGGLLIECPTFIDVVTTIWSLEGSELTLTGQDLEPIVFAIELTADTLTMPGEYLDEDNLGGTKIIFERK